MPVPEFLAHDNPSETSAHNSAHDEILWIVEPNDGVRSTPDQFPNERILPVDDPLSAANKVLHSITEVLVGQELPKRLASKSIELEHLYFKISPKLKATVVLPAPAVPTTAMLRTTRSYRPRFGKVVQSPPEGRTPGMRHPL